MGTYRLVVGEKGNEQGHIIPTSSPTEERAKKALRVALHHYGGDGWGRIEYQHNNGQWERVSL